MKCAGGAADELLLGCWLEPKFGSPAASPPPSAHELLDSLLAPPADLKPLPPFTGYTGHLSINGISGHHYHAIAQRLPEENNNYPPAFPDHDVVSSTCAEPADLSDVKPFLQSEFPAPDSCARSPPAKYDVSSIEDLAAIIGHAIGPSAEAERADSRDSWLDIDSWFSSQHADKLPPELEFGPGSPPAPDFPPCKAAEYKAPEPSKAPGSTLQSLLTHGYMPLLQSRLQGAVKQEAGYPEGVSAGSPPGTVSTTEGLALGGRYAPYGLGLKQEALCPERLVYGAAHTTTGGRKRSRAKPRPAHSSPQFAPPELGLLGKEKPVHRCGICNRGFLNKSNIKVHLRTHTGEKPFRCDVCAKAFRQKAHLIKHQQIHKRIGRD